MFFLVFLVLVFKVALCILKHLEAVGGVLPEILQGNVFTAFLRCWQSVLLPGSYLYTSSKKSKQESKAKQHEIVLESTFCRIMQLKPNPSCINTISAPTHTHAREHKHTLTPARAHTHTHTRGHIETSNKSQLKATVPLGAKGKLFHSSFAMPPVFSFFLHAVLGQHGSRGSFGNGKVKRQAYAAGRLCSYVHVMYVYTWGRLWASRSGSPANDQHWWGRRLQSCTPSSLLSAFINSVPLDPFCNENNLCSFISFSHTFLSWLN